MQEVILKDGKGGLHKVEVTDDNELLVISNPYPPLKPQKVKPFRQYLTDDGSATGNNDMVVGPDNEFWVQANGDNDRYVTSLSFLVGYGSSGQPNEWADGTRLGIGSRLYYTSTAGEVNIHDAIQTNQDMFRLSFSLIPTAWEVRHVNALNDYGYIFSMDLRNLGLEHGIKLDAGTKQKLVLQVNDDLTLDTDSFNIIAYGFERMP